MIETLRRRRDLWPPALVLLGFLAAWHWKPAALQNLRRGYFDALNRARPRPSSPAPLAVVEIDDESLSRLGQWPWPRALTAKLVERARAQGASAVALDFVFAEPDRTSPRQMAALLPSGEAWKATRGKFLTLPDHDELLAKALARGRAVTSFSTTPGAAAAAPARKLVLPAPGPEVASYPGTVVNLPALERAAAGNGSSTIFEDEDGVMRRVPLLVAHQGVLYPGFALEALRVGAGLSSIEPRAGGLQVGPQFVPLSSDGTMRLYYGAEATQRVPAWRLLAPAASAPDLKGAIVLVGLTADGLQDLHSTPVAPAVPGIEIHAQAVAQILSGRFLARPAWAGASELLVLVVSCAGLLLLMRRYGPAWGALGLALLLAETAQLSYAAYTRRGWLLDPVIPSLALAGVYLAGALSLYARSREEKRRLELLDRLKDELISTVSHDLRGPVAGIIMYLDAILKGVYGPLTEKQTSILELLRENGRRLTFFVNNILDAARIKAGRFELHKTELSVENIFAEIDGLYRSAAKAKKVAFEHSAEGALPSFEADREKLEQALNNVLGNALKFTPSGGRITLEAAQAGDRLCLTVRDTGPGIAPELLPTLFGKFEELDLEKPAERKTGVGLGLPICKAIMDAHSGEVAVESEPGKGTTVRLTLPLRRPAAGPASGMVVS